MMLFEIETKIDTTYILCNIIIIIKSTIKKSGNLLKTLVLYWYKYIICIIETYYYSPGVSKIKKEKILEKESAFSQYCSQYYKLEIRIFFSFLWRNSNRIFIFFFYYSTYYIN